MIGLFQVRLCLGFLVILSFNLQRSDGTDMNAKVTDSIITLGFSGSQTIIADQYQASTLRPQLRPGLDLKPEIDAPSTWQHHIGKASIVEFRIRLLFEFLLQEGKSKSQVVYLKHPLIFLDILGSTLSTLTGMLSRFR